MNKMLDDPFLVPSDTWRKAFLVRPLYGKGVYPQFSSGICCVSTLGKLASICVQMHYFVQKGHSPDVALIHVLTGEYGGLRRWMYGDDNRVRGNKASRDDYIAFMGEYFNIEPDEDGVIWLGTILRKDIARAVLPARTYNLKLYQPERSTEMKTFPALGYVRRREVFSQYGEPEIATDIIPFENELLKEFHNSWDTILDHAAKEENMARAMGVALSNSLLTDKEYLMTPEEQMASGQFWSIPTSKTAEYVKSMVGPETRNKLKF
jgi:hypothetical protein